MYTQIRERMQSEKGFTLIELLVVILIIGILAAIAIPAFLSQRTKGQDADAKALARTAQTTMESCATDNNGSYVTCDKLKLSSLEPAVNDSAVVIGGLGTKSFTITVTSDSTKTAIISRDQTTGVVSRSGSVGTW